jgi:hypothetical protein
MRQAAVAMVFQLSPGQAATGPFEHAIFLVLLLLVLLLCCF